MGGFAYAVSTGTKRNEGRFLRVSDRVEGTVCRGHQCVFTGIAGREPGDSERNPLAALAVETAALL